MVEKDDENQAGKFGQASCAKVFDLGVANPV